ncbi:aryl-alcohol oxidase [Moniliophthora roreri MCA 2997]|uniref:Aryl-alcohol oxidase n=1 Tax=Moniliophthora roreri (strain MCA 2997) TaxID=1381753 RepID=V2X1F0_MONRO|nr:aryl-alcohol oxidase [Moniliophthora roreri MCA 2997]
MQSPYPWAMGINAQWSSQDLQHPSPVLNLSSWRYEAVYQLDVNAHYDFIIVGGGTAGSVLANRLTEDGKTKVLVVEAGVNNEGILTTEVPFLATQNFGGPLDWNYTTVPQAGADGRQINAPRGFVLGGSSTINTMYWYRGSNDMWDNFAKLTGDEGWAWESVSKYYLKTSRLVLPQDGRDISGEADPSAHGDGPVNVTLFAFPPPVVSTIEDVVKNSGGQYAFNLDYNSGNTLGFGWSQHTAGGGIHNSAATAYLQPAIQRTNLDVLIHTRATKLYPSNFSGKGAPRIRTVEITSDVSGPRVNVTASKELILSAGSFNTPQLLLLSGIGPKADLEALNIPLVHDSPAVGANLTDHPVLVNIFNVTLSTETLDDALRNATLQAQLLSQWEANRTGIYADTVVPIAGNWKVSANEDPSSGPRSGNIMASFAPSYQAGPDVPSVGRFLSVFTSVMSPTSRGSLKLSSSNPFDPPLIDYGLYTSDFDIKAQVEAMKLVQEFLSLPQFQDIIEGPFGGLGNVTTDQEREEFARTNAEVFSHPSCTASMGPGGVIDSKLKVKGVEGLRVVDASVFPQIPECNTEAPVYIVAERAADLIRIMRLFTALSLFSAAYLSLWPPYSVARLLNNLSELDNNTQYDFIIVGGGTAGSVLANRLTEDGKSKVLAVEAGINNEGVLTSEVPFLASRNYGGLLDWNYTTVPQAGANGRQINVPRGFVLGGSSSINIMYWYRGSDDMWNNFAKLTGDEGWAWESVSKYYLKTSRLVPPQDGRDITGLVDPSAHGDGPVNVTLISSPLPIMSTVVDVVKDSEGQDAFNVDYNSGNTLGIGWGQYSIGGGIRNSAATAYLQPAIPRSNLDVLIHTRATKLHPSDFSHEGTPSIRTVEIASDDNGPRLNITASKEVILSAGSLNTPQLLLLSGIGPKVDLEALNIPLVHDSPAVGANLTEHPFVANIFSVTPSIETLDNVLRNTTLQAQLLSQWKANRTGVYVNSVNNIAWNWKVSANEDPSSGPGSGNIMAVFTPSYQAIAAAPVPPSTGRFISVSTAVISPTSRGSLKLSSSNPFDPPLIDYGLYTSDFDINAQVEAMKMVQDFLSLPQFQGIVEGPFGDLANATTDQEKAAFARANSRTYSHPSCTASMGPGGVVDSRLKVKGVEGLRVVDASVFPQIPECNTQAPVYIVAERAADLIRRDHALCD